MSCEKAVDRNDRTKLTRPSCNRHFDRPSISWIRRSVSFFRWYWRLSLLINVTCMFSRMTDVFVPSSGTLITRGPLNEGKALPVDAYRKPTTASGSRPGTQGGYRFGQLSQNSFFTRHNPHPSRVRHLKGLFLAFSSIRKCIKLTLHHIIISTLPIFTF